MARMTSPLVKPSSGVTSRAREKAARISRGQSMAFSLVQTARNGNRQKRQAKPRKSTSRRRIRIRNRSKSTRKIKRRTGSGVASGSVRQSPHLIQTVSGAITSGGTLMSRLAAFGVMVLSIGLLTAFRSELAAQARRTGKNAEPAAKADKEAPKEPISLAAEPQVAKRIEEAFALLKKEAWPDALRILQGILDGKEDTFLEVREQRRGPDGKIVETLLRPGAKAEINRRLAYLRVQGMDEYQRLYGPKAAELLKEADQKKDPALWAAVSFRY